jgi:SOS response regulatory protein OraA/RecX
VADHAFGVKRAGVRAVAGSLAAAGVSREIIAETVEPHAGDEETRADALAESKAARMNSLEPKKAFSRLTSLLMRRGFGPEIACGAARRALALDLAEDDPSLASRTSRP